jgi:hypothetical protein
MDYWMVRTFDHAGYFETRLVLSVLAFAYALWRRRSGDTRFLIAWVVGVVAHASVEGSLAAAAARGAGYGLAAFGVTFSGVSAIAVQGVAEGGPLMMISFWCATLLRARMAWASEWRAFALACAIVIGLAIVVAIIAQGQPISSARRILYGPLLVTNMIVIVASLLLVGLVRRGAGLRQLLLFAGGVFVYAVVNFTPMQIGGARYVGVDIAGVKVMADSIAQFWVMALSHIVEVAGGKLHYFAIPLAFGWLSLDPPQGKLA